MQAKFFNPPVNVISTAVSSYTHNYTLELPLLTQAACGKELELTATGRNRTVTNKTTIFVKNCKYDYYVHLILLLNHF